MICLAVTYVIQSGREDEAVDYFHRLTEASRAEPGCMQYVVHRSPAEPRKFFLYELYENEASVDAHRATPHFAGLAVNGLWPIAESRGAETYTPIT